MKPTVLILFGNNTLAYNLAVSLSVKFNVYSLVPRNYSLPFNGSVFFKYLKKSPYNDDDPKYLSELLSIGDGLKASKNILTYFSNDQGIEFWIKNKAKLETIYTTNSTNIELLFDKKLLLDSVPHHYFPKTYTEDSDIEFPVVIKPLSKDGGEASFLSVFGDKIAVVKNAEELKRVNEQYHFTYQIQEQVSFSMGGEYSFLGVMIEGKLKGMTFQHKFKYPNKSGRLTMLEFIDSNPLLEIANELRKEIDLNGIFDIQFLKCDKTGRFFLIEINPRFTSGREILHRNEIHWEADWAEVYYGLKRTEVPFENVVIKKWYSSLFIYNKMFTGLIKGREFNGTGGELFFVKVKLFIFVLLKRVIYFKKILWRT